jgi:FkbM family methyltransferase
MRGTGLLDRPGGRTALGLLASLRHWRRHGVWAGVRWVPQQRKWLLSYPDAQVYSARPVLSYYEYKERIARDAYLYAYVPASGDIVVHVGAGSGWEAPLFSRLVGPTGHVYLIEGHPQTYRLLQRRIRAERLGNVTPINVAVSDRAETVRMTNRALHQENRVSEDGTVEVAAETLPAVCDAHHIDRVDLLTINIEGYERQAVRGLAAAAHRIRHIAVSCHDFLADRGGAPWTRTRQEVRAMLDSYGYVVVPRDPADPRDWIRHYLYATRPGTKGNEDGP